MGSTAIGGGIILQSLTQLLGAQNQSSTNNNNLNAMINQQNLMRGAVGNYLSPANSPNPYSQSIMNFIGRGTPTPAYDGYHFGDISPYGNAPGYVDPTQAVPNNPAEHDPNSVTVTDPANRNVRPGVPGGGYSTQPVQRPQVSNPPLGASTGQVGGGQRVSPAPQLPAGFSMGSGGQNQAGYYNGQKIQGVVANFDGQGNPGWQLADGSTIPYDANANNLIQQAANYNYNQGFNQSSQSQQSVSPQYYSSPNNNSLQAGEIPFDQSRYGQYLSGVNNPSDIVMNNVQHTLPQAQAGYQMPQNLQDDLSNLIGSGDPTTVGYSPMMLADIQASQPDLFRQYQDMRKTYDNNQGIPLSADQNLVGTFQVPSNFNSQAWMAANPIQALQAGYPLETVQQAAPGLVPRQFSSSAAQANFVPGPANDAGHPTTGLNPGQQVSPSNFHIPTQGRDTGPPSSGLTGPGTSNPGGGGGQVSPSGPSGVPSQTGGTPGYGMYVYQDPGAFGYSPQGLGQAPTIGNVPQGQAGQVGAPQQAGIGSLFQPQQIGGLPSVSAQQIGGLPQISAQNVSPTNTQGFNTGQDALMQLLTKQITPASDPTMDQNLRQLGSGQNQYNFSDLFKSIQDQGQMNLDKQVAQLQASQGAIGGLGQRFGTGEGIAEGQMRKDYLTNVNAQEQQIGLQAFNQAQQLRQPALNLQADILNQHNQLGLANTSNQLQAATSLAGFGQQGNQLNLQAQLANQGAGLQAQQGNLNAALGVATANQGAGLQAGTTNLQSQLQALLANQQSGLQAGLSGQGLLAQLSQFNAGQGLQAGSLNAQLQNQMSTTNLGAQMQALLANQGILGQYGVDNANIQNQARQFNAQMGQSANQFAANQGNTYNNQILGALSQAGGFQQQQSSYNAALLGLLNQVGVPQAQPSPYPQALGNIGGTAAMLPFLNQLYSQGGSSNSAYPYSSQSQSIY